MLTISLWNKIVSFSVIIPVIYGILNWKQLYAVRAIIYILIVSFIFESIATVSLTIYKIPAPNIGVFYQAIEIFFFSIFISKIIDLRYKWFLYSSAFLLTVYSIIMVKIANEFTVNDTLSGSGCCRPAHSE